MGETTAEPTVTLKEAAAIFGVKLGYMQVLPSRYGPDSNRPFPPAAPVTRGREKRYSLTALRAWMDGRESGGRPRSRPPEYMSEGQWVTLCRISQGGIRQLPYGDRYWGTHPVGDGGGLVLDQRVVGSLMVEGYIRSVGRRDKGMRYELTPDGRAVLAANPEWVARVQLDSMTLT